MTQLMARGLRSTEVARRLGIDSADVHRLLFAGELDGGPGPDGLVSISETPGAGHDGGPLSGAQRYGLLWMAAVGNFVPEIVPGSDGTLEIRVPQGHTPVKASFAETIAKVGVAGSNPVVRSKTSGQDLAEVRTQQASGHNSPDTGHNRSLEET